MQFLTGSNQYLFSADTIINVRVCGLVIYETGVCIDACAQCKLKIYNSEMMQTDDQMGSCCSTIWIY